MPIREIKGCRDSGARRISVCLQEYGVDAECLDTIQECRKIRLLLPRVWIEDLIQVHLHHSNGLASAPALQAAGEIRGRKVVSDNDSPHAIERHVRSIESAVESHAVGHAQLAGNLISYLSPCSIRPYDDTRWLTGKVLDRGIVMCQVFTKALLVGLVGFITTGGGELMRGNRRLHVLLRIGDDALV